MAKLVLSEKQRAAFEALRVGVTAVALLDSWDAEALLAWLRGSFDGPVGLSPVIRAGCEAAMVAVDEHEDYDGDE